MDVGALCIMALARMEETVGALTTVREGTRVTPSNPGTTEGTEGTGAKGTGGTGGTEGTGVLGGSRGVDPTVGGMRTTSPLAMVLGEARNSG